MKQQAGKQGKGKGGQKPQGKLVRVDPRKRQHAVQQIASQRPGQRAQAAANRAKAKKK